MGTGNQAQHMFWELIEDFGEWSVHQLNSDHAKGPEVATKILAIAQTGGLAIKAAILAKDGKWKQAADTCVDMSSVALNFVTHGQFGAAKGIVWDIAVAAHVAKGGKAESFSEITKHLVHKIGEKSGEKAFEFFHPFSVEGSGAGVREYYDNHPEMYRGHVVDGKLHFDRFKVDENGNYVLLHPNFTTSDGHNVYLSPDHKSLQFDPVGAPSQSPENGKKADQDSVKTSAKGLSEDAGGSKPPLPSSDKSGKIDGLLKGIELFSKEENMSPEQKSASEPKPDIEKLLKDIDSFTSSSSTNAAKPDKLISKPDASNKMGDDTPH